LIKLEKQEHNRYRFWAAIEELDERFLRVVTLEDKITIQLDLKELILSKIPTEKQTIAA